MGKMAKEECVEIRQEGLGWSPKNINILEIRRGVEPIKKNSSQRGRRKIKRLWYQSFRESFRKEDMVNNAKCCKEKDRVVAIEFLQQKALVTMNEVTIAEAILYGRGFPIREDKWLHMMARPAVLPQE